MGDADVITLPNPTLPHDWLDFGPADPLEARWIAHCARCAGPARLQSASSGATRASWVCGCPTCGESAHAADTPYEAVFAWNRSASAERPSYEDLPFFNLQGLSEDQARRKVGLIRQHLQYRLAVASEERRSGRPVGYKYFHRLRAYVQWAMYAESILPRPHSGRARLTLKTRKEAPRAAQ